MNLRDYTADQLTTLKNRILSELQARRRASKPKRVKVESAEERERRKGWEAMALMEENCWACGRTRLDVPEFWGAGWFLERAHVVNQTRVESVKVAVVLCSLCHRRAHNERIAGCDLPPLTKAHLLYLLMERTAVDWTYLKKHNGGVSLPCAEQLPAEYLECRERFNPGAME